MRRMETGVEGRPAKRPLVGPGTLERQIKPPQCTKQSQGS